MFRRIFLLGVLALGALAGTVQGDTVAYFRSTATDTANTFSAGTIDIATSPASASITLSGMVPGETIVAPITVINSGTLPTRYALSSEVTNPDGKGIGAQLDLTIKQGVASCTGAGFGASGSVVYGVDGPLGALGASLNLVGNPSAYPNGGRTLAAGASEALCFQVKLPAASGTAYQGAATTATLTLVAEQS